MTCPTCQPWCATTVEQLINRRCNLAAQPPSKPYICPGCQSDEWTITDKYITTLSIDNQSIDNPRELSWLQMFWRRFFGQRP